MSKDNPVRDWTCEKSGSAPGFLFSIDDIYKCILWYRNRKCATILMKMLSDIHSIKWEKNCEDKYKDAALATYL